MSNVVRIIEEVPGVPDDEQYFLTREGETQHFRTATDAVKYCEHHGLDYIVIPFEP